MAGTSSNSGMAFFLLQGYSRKDCPGAGPVRRFCSILRPSLLTTASTRRLTSGSLRRPNCPSTLMVVL